MSPRVESSLDLARNDNARDEPSLPPSFDGGMDIDVEDGGVATNMNMDVDVDNNNEMETSVDNAGDMNGEGGSEDTRPGHRFGKRRATDHTNTGRANSGGVGIGNGSGSGSSSQPPQLVDTERMNRAFGGETWEEFLRNAGDGEGDSMDNGLRAPPHVTRRPLPAGASSRGNSGGGARPGENPLPAIPVEIASPPLVSPSLQPHHHQQQQQQHSSNPRRPRSYSGVPASNSSERRALPPPPPAHSLSDHTQLRQAPGDRKRRLTTSDQPTRRASGVNSVNLGSRNLPPPPPPIQTPGSGSSGSAPVALDVALQPPGHPHPVRMSSAPSAQGRGASRRESDLVLPPWQPDADVTHCFVCGSQFTWFYRKHHCRKCGRVVCAGCSPHRITIPRQFIVHPPSETPSALSLTNEDENTMSPSGSFRNPALGGGEEVRVCNPCVPDPNYNPPVPHPSSGRPPVGPGSISHYLQRASSSNPQAFPTSIAPIGVPTDFRHMAAGYGRLTNAEGIRGSPQVRVPSYNYQPAPQYNNQPASQYSHPLYQAHTQTRTHSRNVSTPLTPGLHQSGHRYSVPQRVPAPSSSYSHFATHSHSPTGTGINFPFTLGASNPAPPQPRREIPEEDECPICGNELPPKGPDNDEAARIKHVEDCIALHSSSPPQRTEQQQNQPPTSTSLPSQRTRGMSNAATLLNLSTRNYDPAAAPHPSNPAEGASSSAANTSRLSMAARGMYVYTATEKDCVDDEGTEAECVICFDEFEAGVRMARLVCFCKFHEACIKHWWEVRGRGACPTHQLHD